MIKKDIPNNTLVVGTESEAGLYSNALFATEWHRIGEAPTLPLDAYAKIRYRQPDQRCTVENAEGSIMKISFIEPQRAVASGQIVAIYQ